MARAEDLTRTEIRDLRGKEVIVTEPNGAGFAIKVERVIIPKKQTPEIHFKLRGQGLGFEDWIPLGAVIKTGQDQIDI